MSILNPLELYTQAHPEEVLVVTAQHQGEAEMVLIFRGFSSSLTRPTAFDPDIPILDDTATIETIDRLASPYNPENPQYIERGLTVGQIEALIERG
ncbi:MAG: hypothetical protein EA366_04830 [Spirulina sp. DLM2.Bin59]|nr:MAG: hypothetical protein EA366_04830 [Spirulina sp. DLM2.Bin59]